MIAPEAAPFAKTGGLGDVVGALSREMAMAGHEVRVVIPAYGSVRHRDGWAPHPDPVAVHISPWNTLFCRFWTLNPPAHPAPPSAPIFHFVEHNEFFGENAIYTEPRRDAYRFAFLTLAALDFCLQTQWHPDVVHAHDWPAALAPVFLNTTRRGTALGRAASVFTIHNLFHQGIVPASLMEWLRLPSWLYTADNLECFGALNLMKGALYHATKITTVSPNYAREIQTLEHGCGLDPVLRHRAGDLAGILNGIDLAEWNPAADPHIAARFNAADAAQGKAANKAALQHALQLNPDAGIPLFGVVSRLYEQKGLDLLADLLPALLENAHMQFALLGSGEARLEDCYRNLAARFPGRCAVRLGFDNKLAHLIEAGADFFLMPSRFEPCGLNQMYSMRYGTLPIVRATGGLADTVEDWGSGHGAKTGTGIVFHEFNHGEILHAIHRALQLYFDFPPEFTALRRNALARDFSWKKPVAAYLNVYAEALKSRRGQGAATPPA
jgi:starch synthase